MAHFQVLFYHNWTSQFRVRARVPVTLNFVAVFEALSANAAMITQKSVLLIASIHILPHSPFAAFFPFDLVATQTASFKKKSVFEQALVPLLFCGAGV
jgi:hypothetical protein